MRILAGLISFGRLVFGVAFITQPTLMERAWIGKQARLPGAQVLARAVGARDLALGLGGVQAVARNDGSARPWLAAAAICDVVDFGATRAAGRGIPEQARTGVLAIAGVSAVLSAIAAAGSGRPGHGGDPEPAGGRGLTPGLVEDLVESLARGNVTEVKVILASVALALACYQLVLIAVGYGKVRPSLLEAEPASRAHRAVGDTIAVVLVLVALMCISYFGIEDDATLHAVAASALLVVLAVKVAIIRRWHGLGRFLPALGISVFFLLALTWLTSAGDFLADG